MKIRYLHRHRIDAARWDACVAASGQRLVYTFSWYLDAVAHHWGGLVAEADGEYRAVMPVPYRKKYGFAYVQQPAFCPQLGVFSRPEVDLEAVFPLFWAALRERFHRVVSYRFNERNEAEICFPVDAGRVVRENQVLPLNRSYATLRAGFSSDRKTNLNRARNTGWRVEESTDTRALIRLHRVHNEANATRDYPKLDLSLYDRLVRVADELHKRGLLRLCFAELEGRKEAGCLFVRDGGRLIYLFNGASPAGRRRQGRLWLLNEIFQKHAGEAVDFDFESPAEGAETVKAYYRSFGSETRRYSEVRWNRGIWGVVHAVRERLRLSGSVRVPRAIKRLKAPPVSSEPGEPSGSDFFSNQ